MMKLMNKSEKAEHAEKLAQKERADRRDSWRKFYMTRDYVAVDDGAYITLRKQGIQSEFWYDDEYASPLTNDAEQRREYFIAANLAEFNDYGFGEWKKCKKQLAEYGCCSGRYLFEPFVAIYKNGGCYPYFMASSGEVEQVRAIAETRPMTNEEIAQFEEIIDAQRAKFEKRLETYWKKYADKVCAHGYWANR